MFQPDTHNWLAKFSVVEKIKALKTGNLIFGIMSSVLKRVSKANYNL